MAQRVGGPTFHDLLKLQVLPVLRDAGFVKRGSVLRREIPGRHTAILVFSPRRRSSYEGFSEFYLGQGVYVPAVYNFLWMFGARDSPDLSGTFDCAWRRNVHKPPGYRDGARELDTDCWLYNEESLNAASAALTARIHDLVLPTLDALSDPGGFATYVTTGREHEESLALSKIYMTPLLLADLPGTPGLEVALERMQESGRDDLTAALTAFVEDWKNPQRPPGL